MYQPSNESGLSERKTLSKSRFKLALECPTTVYYSLDKRYVNANENNEFLKSLAFGGFQVGELAKAMFRAEDPSAVEIEGDQPEQIAQTAELIKRENVTLFEPTFLEDNLLARVDILKKRGNAFDLFEVKSIAWDASRDSLVGKTSRSDPLAPAWRSYVFDVAFQQRLLQRCLPSMLGHREFILQPWLLLLNKHARCSINSLAFQFPIVGNGRTAKAATSATFDVKSLKDPLLIAVNAMEATSLVFKNKTRRRKGTGVEFEALISEVSTAIQSDARIEPSIGTACKTCEFYNDEQLGDTTQRSGWAECMSHHYGTMQIPDRDQSIFGLYRRAPIDELVRRNRLWLKDLEDDELRASDSNGFSIALEQRHRLQREEARGNNRLVHINSSAIHDTLKQFKFPLHFIDFETARPALPYYKGHHSYQTILFQFSHHVMEADGRICHATEFLKFDRNSSPSIDAVRALCNALSNDHGTVLHWYHHERTVLREVAEEIEVLCPPDTAVLIEFLNTLGLDKGTGRLFDFGRLMEEQVFIAGTRGSSSMKRFLPAVLSQSRYLQEKYSQPVYGSRELPSKNFDRMTWIKSNGHDIQDPYTLLNPIFNDLQISSSLEALERTEGPVVSNGAAAMLAYERLLKGTSEEQQIVSELKRYCELDTLGMVFVYEWLYNIRNDS